MPTHRFVYDDWPADRLLEASLADSACMRIHSTHSLVITALTVGGLVLVTAGCEPVEPRGPGAIAVSAHATAIEGPYFVYGVAIDGGTPRTEVVGQPLSFVQAGLGHGKHVVTVTGVPAACAGRDPHDVVLRGDDTARVTVAIACPRTTGDVSINVRTSGSDADADGYLAMIDGSARALVPANGSALARFVPPGTHSVALGGVASNCSAGGTQAVVVTAGGTATASFTVTCSPIAVLRIEATVTGSDRDPDGYSLQVGTLPPVQIARAGTTLYRLSPGSWTWALGDVQPNCTLVGGASGTATLTGGDTTTVTIAATCSAIPLGDVGTTVSDPAVDTLRSQFTGSTTPHDILGVTARYASGWMNLVLRFAKPVKSSSGLDAQALYGFIELDTDEDAGTGVQPAANRYGASASIGVDYAISFASDSVSARLYGVVGTQVPYAGRVRTRYEGDSVIVHIPLNKLKGDDGRMALVMVLGTYDRPTDVAPNTGVIAVRPPSSAIVAAETRLQSVGPAFAARADAGAVARAAAWERLPVP